MSLVEEEVLEDESSNIYRKTSVISIADHDDFVESTKHQRRAITVEPLVFFYIVIMYLQTSVISQYIYYRVGVDYNITTNSSLAYVCNNQDNSSAEKEKTDKLQDINTTYMMYIAMVSAVCTILTAPFYSVFSDRFGRRIMFLLPGIGTMFKSLTELVIIHFQWSIKLFVFTEGLYGLCGGFNFAVGLCYCYIADISSSKNRTRRLAILGSMMGIGALGVSLLTGFWIKNQGYFIPYACSSVFSILCFVYPLVFLKEPLRMEPESKNHLPFLKQLRTLVTIYIGRPREQAIILGVVVVMFNFYYIAEMATFGIISTYLMSFPLCMSTIDISYFMFTNMAAINIGVAISVIVLSKYIPELIIILICLVSGFIYAIQMAFANGPIAAYIAAATNVFSFSAFQFIRGFLSKQVGPLEQGALFGGLMLSETIGGAITKVVSVYFYKKTFRIFHGMVFLFIACFSIIAFMLTLITAILQRRNKNTIGFAKLN